MKCTLSVGIRSDFAGALDRWAGFVAFGRAGQPIERGLAALEGEKHAWFERLLIEGVNRADHPVDFSLAIEVHLPARVEPAEGAVGANHTMGDFVSAGNQSALNAGEPEEIPIFRVDVGEETFVSRGKVVIASAVELRKIRRSPERTHLDIGIPASNAGRVQGKPEPLLALLEFFFGAFASHVEGTDDDRHGDKDGYSGDVIRVLHSK